LYLYKNKTTFAQNTKEVPVVRSYPLSEARTEFSKLIDRALAGEPQRVTRHGKDAVVIVSEAEWERRRPKYASLGALLADFARRGIPGADVLETSSFKQTRPLGADFLQDDD
jgi:prevent-host-death family protein